MNSDWKYGNIGDFVNLSQGLAINAKSKYLIVEKGLPLLRITDLLNNTYNQFIDADKVPQKCVAVPEDVIFTRTGQVGLVYTNKTGVVHNNCFKVIPKDSSLDRSYLYWFLRQGKIVSYVNSVAAGSVQKDLNHSAFKTIPFNLPPLPEQKAIAHILGRLDDKIELNRQMNQTLEAMAQALFKSWFVDFDPVLDNALAAGNPIPVSLHAMAEKRKGVPAEKILMHTNPELAEKFPNSFAYNETLDKWIPEGWEDTNMNECLDTISKTYNLKKVEEIIFLNTGDIEEGRFLHNTYSKTKGLPGQAKKSIQEGDILYSEIRPKNKRFAYVYFDSKDYVVSTKLMVLRPKGDIDSLFFYHILKADSTLNELQFLAETRSGTFPQITFDTLKAIRFALPKEHQIVKHFTKVLKANFERSVENQKQTETLTQLRDTLLPQLISGKVRMPEGVVEKMTIVEVEKEVV